MYKVYYGIDPGAKGALCGLCFHQGAIVKVDIKDLPQSIEGWFECIEESRRRVGEVRIEEVHAIPGQSSQSMFSYGGNFKLAELLACSINARYVKISPQRWKNFYGLKRQKDESKTEYKKRSVLKARELLGRLYCFKDSKDGQAEAALIALYGYCNEHNVKPEEVCSVPTPLL